MRTGLLIATILAAAAPVRADPAPRMSMDVHGAVDAADGMDHHGLSSFQMVAEVLEVGGVPRQPEPGLLFNEQVREEYDDLRGMIRSGGR